MESIIDFPENGCYCDKVLFSFFDSYCFNILPGKCSEEVVVPPFVDGIPVTGIRIVFESGHQSTSLKRLVVPAGVRRIEDPDILFDLYFAEDIEVIVDKDNPYFFVHGGVLYRQRMALVAVDRHRESYEILPRTRMIWFNAFNKCAMHSVRLPPSVRRICDSAFSDCENLGEINLDNVRYIGEAAFSFCNIRELVLPPGLRTIDNLVFSNGSGHVVIPKTVEDIGGLAFDGYYEIEVYDEVRYDILEANIDAFELSVRSSETGKLLYKLFFTDNWEMCKKSEKAFEKRGEFDFALYDEFFDQIVPDENTELFYGSDAAEKECFAAKLSICFVRLMYPYRLSEAAEARYKKFIRDNRTLAVKAVTDMSDLERLNFLLELGAVVPENIVELAEYCVQRGKTEFTAALLAYKGEHFPAEFYGSDLE